MHNRRQEAHILSEFFTDTANAAKQLAILLEIDHRDQTVTHFHPQGIFQLNVVPGGFHGLRVLRHFNRHRFCRRFHFAATHPPGQAQQRRREQQEHQVRHARHQTEQTQHRRRQQHHARIAKQLPDHLLTNVLIGTDAGDDHARGGRNHQRRDLGHQTVTDGQQRIAFRRVSHVHAMLQNTHQQAAHHVNHHDENARDGITTHKLTRTVHRAIEVRFLGHFRTAFFRFIFRDESGVEVGVDRHLLTWHPVQHKARTHFRDTPRTFSDNHKVDDNEDDEHHDADGKVTAHEEVAERLDHFTGRCRTGMPFHQDDTRGRHVQRQSQQGGKQQNGRERRELKGTLGEHRHQQHHDGQRNVESEKQIEDECRQRQYHHRQD